MPLTNLLTAARNLVADTTAGAVASTPWLEPPFIACGRLLTRLPLLHTLYRRSVDTLTQKLEASHRQFRRCRIRDVEFTFDISDFTVGPWYFKRHLFEPLTTQFVLDALRPGQTFVDIGSNRGYYTILAAKRVGSQGRVYSFEPNPAVLQDLRALVAANKLEDRVVCSPLALSDECRPEVEFFLSTCPANSGLSSLTRTMAPGALSDENKILVATDTLDRWVEAAALPGPIDAMKIDVEGGELMVLEGARRLLREMPPEWIVCETRKDGPVPSLLADYGYRSSVLDQYGDIVNFLFTRR